MADVETAISAALYAIDEFVAEELRAEWPVPRGESRGTGGRLRVDQGGIRIYWGTAQEPDLALPLIHWDEVGGPPV